MNESYIIELPGCTPVPLAGYLKALGIMRIVANQVDGAFKGFWKDEIFHLQSPVDEKALLSFFADEYCPTPVIAPWNGGSGFYANDNRQAITEITTSAHKRFRLYRDTIQTASRLLEQLGLTEKPKDDNKMQLLVACRNELADEVVEWIDAVAMLSKDDPKFPPLLGTGGNDGRLEFTNNFMKNLTQLFDMSTGKPTQNCRAWLDAALFRTPTQGMVKSAIGQFAPGQAGGPNATSGFTAEASINPWDFVLMMEGAIVFSAAASRKHENTRIALLSYPFTVLPAGVGNGSTSLTDEDTSQVRAEMWLPLWQQPTSFREIALVFREGRVQLKRMGRKNRRGYRAAVDGVDFARACATLAVDRGIQSFQRYAFMKRAGKSYFAVPLTRFEVQRQTKADLLVDLEDWVDDLAQYCRAPEAPGSFQQALRRIKSSMFELAELGGVHRVRRLLIDLAQVEQLCVHSRQARAQIRPLVLSNVEWLREAADGSDEWVIALALASLYNVHGVAPLRAYLSPVDPDAPWRWSEEHIASSVVWGLGDASRCLTRVLERRVQDWRRGRKEGDLQTPSQRPQNGLPGAVYGLDEQHHSVDNEIDVPKQKYSSRQKPFDASMGVSLAQIHSFLYGPTRLRQNVAELLWALLPFTSSGVNGVIHTYAKEVRGRLPAMVHKGQPTFVPWAYAVSRLVVMPNSHLSNGKFQPHGEQMSGPPNDVEADAGLSIGTEEVDIPIPGALINLLVSEQIRAATDLAEQRLIGSGLKPSFRALSTLATSGKDCAAALLIPLNARASHKLRETVIVPSRELE